MKILKVSLLVAAATSALLTASLPAATLYWDGSASNPNGASDNTETATQDWLSGGFWDDGAGSSAPLATWTDNDDAVFGGELHESFPHSQTVTLTGAITVGNLTFGVGPGNPDSALMDYVISGGTITLGSASTITTNIATSINSTISAPDNAFTKLGAATLTLGSPFNLTTDFQFNTNGGTLVLAGGIIGTDTSLTVDGVGNTVISGGGLSLGTGALTKNGSGKLTLAAAGTYTGVTQVNAGTLEVQHSGALGTTDVGTVVAAGGTLAMSGDIAVLGETLSLTGTGASGGGALRNSSGANTYGGAITLETDTRINSDNGSLTLSGGVIGVAKNLTVGGAGDTVISAAGLSLGTGSLTKDGSGTLVLSGTNDYSGETRLAGGALELGDVESAGTGTIRFAGGTLRYGVGNTHDYSSRFATVNGQSYSVDTNGQNVTWTTALNSFEGTLTKSGSGTLTLVTANNYTGTTTISGGTLALDLGASSQIIAPGNTLNLAGGTLDFLGVTTNRQTFLETLITEGVNQITKSTFTGTVANGGGVDLGVIVVNSGTLSIDGLLSDPAGNADAWIKASGMDASLAYISPSVTTNDARDLVGTNSLKNLVVAGSTSVERGTAAPVAPAVGLVKFDGADGGDITLGGESQWNGMINAYTSGTTTLNLGADTLHLGVNAVIASSAGSDLVITGGTLTAGGNTPDTAGVIRVGNANAVRIESVITDNGAGVVGLTVRSPGTTTLTGANTYTGDTTVSGGTLTLDLRTTSQVINHDNSATGGKLILSGGTLNFLGDGTDNTGPLPSTQAFTEIRVTSGTNHITKTDYNRLAGTDPAMPGNAIFIKKLTVDQGAYLDIADIPDYVTQDDDSWVRTESSGLITTLATVTTNQGQDLVSINALGNLTKARTSVVTRGDKFATNGYASEGDPNITLINLTDVLKISPTGINDSAGTITLTPSEQNIAGCAGIINACTLGTTTIDLNGATLHLNPGSDFGAIMSVAGSDLIIGLKSDQVGRIITSGFSTTTFVTTCLEGNSITINSALVDDAPVALLHNGPGKLILTSDNNNYSGATTIAGGVLQVGDGGDTGKLGSGDVINNGSLVINRSGLLTITNNISGSGSLTLVNTGPGSLTFSLTGNNTYTGLTTIGTGVLEIQSGNALGSTASGTVIAPGSALWLNNAAGISVGTEALTLSGTGAAADGAMRNIAGANTYAGAITLQTDSRINSDAGSTLTLSGGVTGTDRNLTIGGDGDTVVSTAGIALGSGGLTKDGAGILTLAAANTYTGPTLIAGGVLEVAAAENAGTGPLGTGAISFTGGTLRYSAANAHDYSSRFVTTPGQRYNVDTNGRIVTWATALTSDAGTLTKSGAGTLALTGANTYSGNTVIAGGALEVAAAEGAGVGPLGTGTISFTGGTLRHTAANTHDYSSRFATTPGQQYNVDTNGQTVTWATALTSDAGTVTKSGDGTLSLTGANTYSGATVIAGGSLEVASAEGAGAGPLGTGTISFTGGTLRHTDVNTHDYSSRFATTPGQLYGVDTNGHDVTWAAALTSDTGTLTKDGAGTLTLTGDNTYTGLTTVNAGKLVIGAGSSTAALTINTGGALGGGGTVRGDLINNGTLAPGFSPGTITVSGNFTQNSSGILLEEIGDTAHDQINATGTASVAGTLQVISFGEFIPLHHQRFTIITADGGVSGAFATLLENYAYMKVTPLYNANDVTLEFEYDVMGPRATFLGLTPNRIATARGLDNAVLADRTYAPLLGEIATLDDAPFAAALAELSPQGYERLWDNTKYNAAMLSHAVENRMQTLRGDDPGENLWMQVLHRQSHSDGDADIAASGYNSNGVIIGADTAFGSNFSADDKLSVGAMFSYTNDKVDLGRGGRSTVNHYLPGIYARYRNGDAFVEGMAAWGYADYSSKRKITIGATERTAKSHTEAQDRTIGARAGYDFRLFDDTFRIAPYAGFQHTRWDADGFTETGADLANLSVHDMKAESTVSGLGLMMSTPIPAGDWVISPKLDVAWRHEFQQSRRDITANFGPAPFTVRTTRPAEDALEATVGLDVQITPGTTVYANFSTFMDGSMGHSEEYRVGVNFKF